MYTQELEHNYPQSIILMYIINKPSYIHTAEYYYKFKRKSPTNTYNMEESQKHYAEPKKKKNHLTSNNYISKVSSI